MLNAIANNPYRILGVYANSPIKDIVANKAKMSAFLKVGKAISFPLDLTSFLGEINRTIETVSSADSQLTIENDKLNAAQFWFFNITPFDKIAFNHISKGDINEAMAIWEKQDNVSSLQNRAVCYMLLNEIENAVKCLSVLYDKYNADFIAAIGINHNVQMNELVQGFVTTIIEQLSDIDFKKISGEHCSEKWNSAATDYLVKPLIKKLTDTISTAKQSKSKEPQQRLEAGKKLLMDAKPILFKLRQLLSASNLQFINISDKVCNEVLQCGIDFYNDNQSPFSANESLQLVKEASMLAMGTMAKSRCDENLKTISEVVESLPPPEVEDEANQIYSALQQYYQQDALISNSLQLIDNTKAPLEAMKAKLGENHIAYTKQCSLVANNALNHVISELNALIDKANNGHANASSVKYSLERSLKVMTALLSMPLDDETYTRVVENNNTIVDMYNSINRSSNSDDNSGWGGCISLIILLIIILLKNCT